MKHPFKHSAFFIMALLSLIFQQTHAQQARQVADLLPGADGFFAINGNEIIHHTSSHIYFTDVQDNHTAIWQSDGTEEGTIEVTRIDGRSGVNIIGENGADLILKTPDHVFWIWDVENATMDSVFKASGYRASLIFDSHLFVHHDPGDDELIRVNLFDGSKEVIYTYGFGGAKMLTVANGTVMTIGPPEPGDGMSLFKYNGSALEIVTAIEPTEIQIRDIAAYGDDNGLYFFYYLFNQPYRLLYSDGTENGTNIIYDALQRPIPLDDFKAEGAFLLTDDHFFFTGVPADECTNCYEVYAVDRSNNAVTHLDTREDDIETGRSFIEYDGQVFYEIQLFFGRYLAKTDGTLEGTERFNEADSVGWWPTSLHVYNDTLFYAAWTEGEGRELHYFLPEESGQLNVFDVNPGPADAFVEQITSTDDQLFFVADNGALGPELFVLDHNLTSIHDIRPDAELDGLDIIAGGNQLLIKYDNYLPIHVTIYNSGGQVISNIKAETNEYISPNLISGQMYIIEVHSRKGYQREKVVWR